MRCGRFSGLLAGAAMLASCGGGDDGGIGPGGSTSASPTPTPTTAVAGCSLRERQNWAFAQLNEWYLFPETLPTSLDPSGYSTVDDYIDALTATARAQRKDRYFTYLTSISSENAYYNSGTTSGGWAGPTRRAPMGSSGVLTMRSTRRPPPGCGPSRSATGR